MYNNTSMYNNITRSFYPQSAISKLLTLDSFAYIFDLFHCILFHVEKAMNHHRAMHIVHHVLLSEPQWCWTHRVHAQLYTIVGGKAEN